MVRALASFEGFRGMVRRRIELDRAAVEDVQIKALLEVIARNLGNPSLSVKWAKEQAVIRNNSVAIYFHIQLGVPPGRYIEAAKLDIATGLLCATDLPVWRIADLTGYSGTSTFSRAFWRRSGVRPRKARQMYRGAVASTGEAGDGLRQLSMSGLRVRHGVASVERGHVWRPLTHVLDVMSSEAKTEVERWALRFAAVLLRFLELGLDRGGALRLALLATPQVELTPDGLLVGRDLVAQVLDDQTPGREFVARIVDAAVAG
ncbi:MAG: AraC family transcriptional regulator [Acidobacteriota bacterium]